jgi:hypothetical protein
LQKRSIGINAQQLHAKWLWHTSIISDNWASDR